jgi:hypothetical protein
LSWLACSSTTQPARRSPESELEEEVRSLLESRAQEAITPLRCPLVWAGESNAFDCVSLPIDYRRQKPGLLIIETALQSLVFDYPNFSDLCTSSYFDDAVPIVRGLSLCLRKLVFSLYTLGLDRRADCKARFSSCGLAECSL